MNPRAPRHMVMSRNVTTALLALGFALVFAGPASAGTVSYQDVLRYRYQPRHEATIHITTVRPASADGRPGQLPGFADPPLSAGPGCHVMSGRADNFVCTLTTPGLHHRHPWS
jgi:hypothetical protein